MRTDTPAQVHRNSAAAPKAPVARRGLVARKAVVVRFAAQRAPAAPSGTHTAVRRIAAAHSASDFHLLYIAMRVLRRIAADPAKAADCFDCNRCKYLLFFLPYVKPPVSLIVQDSGESVKNIKITKNYKNYKTITNEL